MCEDRIAVFQCGLTHLKRQFHEILNSGFSANISLIGTVSHPKIILQTAPNLPRYLTLHLIEDTAESWLSNVINFGNWTPPSQISVVSLTPPSQNLVALLAPLNHVSAGSLAPPRHEVSTLTETHLSDTELIRNRSYKIMNISDEITRYSSLWAGRRRRNWGRPVWFPTSA
jgi:hypothetical protein